MKTATIQAIETEYAGILFRSRLEARWAVFFDALGIPWQYEPEAYTDGTTSYLPDFWLPRQDCFFEVKGSRKYDEAGPAMLAKATGKNLFVAFGDIGCVSVVFGEDCPNAARDLGDSMHKFFGGGEGWDCDHLWCECPNCGALGIQYQGRAERLPCQCLQDSGREYNPHSPRLHVAFTQARGKRFWEPTVRRPVGVELPPEIRKPF